MNFNIIDTENDFKNHLKRDIIANSIIIANYYSRFLIS